MMLQAPVSIGELIDKLTILEIKLVEIADEPKRRNISREYLALSAVLPETIGGQETVARLREQLKAVNLRLWRIEDDIRACERAQNFGSDFVELARSVYRVNDMRADLKRQINVATQSELVEEKSYQAY